MQYGFFDDAAKEYVITNPETPQSWSNYLGSTEYGGIITNNAGGYSFYKTGARGRFLRLRFNSIPMDQPGRYFYIRDADTNDYWSASWQPVGKNKEEYESVCRHGTAYSKISSKYNDIHSETTYFVPLGQTFEYWRLKLTNTGTTKKCLSIFTYCEFTNQWDTYQDQVNLQYSSFIVKGSFSNDVVSIAIQENLSKQHRETGFHSLNPSDNPMNCWMHLAGAPITGFDTCRNSFLGTYGSYHNPLVVQTGKCTNSMAYGDNACGCLETKIELLPGESKEIIVMLGIGEAKTTGEEAVKKYGNSASCETELIMLKQFWHSKLESFIAKTPDEDINNTVNMWGLYNCLITFAWSRAASLVYNGERDGLGFRDSVQDILGVSAAIPEEAQKRLELMLTGQLSNGGAIPVIKPFEHSPGNEKEPPKEEYRSDDCLWFFNAVPVFVSETGLFDFYTKELPYADYGKGTVFEHLKQALLFNLERMGKHNLPCGLSADWNDCLRLGYEGESLFVAFQLRLSLTVYSDIAIRLQKPEESVWALQKREYLDEAIQTHCWDEDRFIWAIGEDGTKYGSKKSPEGSLYFNTQVWSVLSGAATKKQAITALHNVHEILASPYGIMLSAPPFINTSINVMRAVVFNPGIKENAGIFNHTQGWGIIAETMMNNGNTAYEYCKASLPAAWNTKAEVRQSEPYVQAQTTYSPFSPRPGNSRVSWLSGAATWSYYSLTQFILGIRPEYEGLRIDPCIPSHWTEFTVTRKFRNKTIFITIKNPLGVQKGVSELYLNSKLLTDNFLHIQDLLFENTVLAIMG